MDRKIDHEYNTLLLTRSLFGYLRYELKKYGGFTKISGLLERWLMEMVQLAPSKKTIYHYIKIGDPINQQLIEEISRLLPPSKSATRIVKRLLHLAKHPQIKSSSPSTYHLPKTDRVALLISRFGIKLTRSVCLRYESLIFEPKQWSLPRDNFKYLYEEWDVRNEGYASPLDSHALEYKDGKYCSLFPDLETKMGSLGPFPPKKKLSGNWVLNPPFVETIMLRAIESLLEEMEAGRIELAFLLLPNWDTVADGDGMGDEAYRVASENPYFQEKIVIPRVMHLYETHQGTARVANFDTCYFLLSRCEVSEEKISLLRKNLLPEQEDSEEEVVYF